MKKYCIIGKKLGHTLSPQIHGEFGLHYCVRELADKKALEAFLKSHEFSGFNITIPYKQTVIPYLYKVDGLAKEIGAVNTVVDIDGKLYGYNTDILGLKYALNKAGIKLKNKNVMILGSGGASKTAQYLCKSEGANEIMVVSRKGEINYENCYTYTDTEVIINTTPVGMYPDNYSKPLNLEKFRNLEGVYDLIYNPLTTVLVQEAKAKGIKTDNGLSMLVAQAKYARDIFSNDTLDDGIISEITKNLTKNLKNIVLIGMPSSGKTCIGREVAKILDREFIDTDEEIEKKVNMSIPEIFDKYGEDAFRKLEKEVVAEVSKEFNKVIATGGGAVLSEQNRIALHGNGTVFLIERDLKCLSLAGRPLSKDYETLCKMWEYRSPVYRSTADYTLYNSDSIESAVQGIVKIFMEKF